VLKPRLEGTADTDPEAIKKNLQLLDAAFALYEKGQRPDLAVVLRLMQGKYLEKVGRSEDALKHYETCSEKYADQHYGVTDLFDSALKLMAGPDKDVARFKYLDQMANLVPEYPTEFNRQNHYINPVYSHVVVAYANALIAAGKTAEAAQWAAKIGAKLKSSGG
jgi:tetratricopeptide (TPR) repeat protein